MPTTQEFTIYETGLHRVNFEDKEILIETWIVNDEFFDAPCWVLPKGVSLALAKLVTPWALKELDIEKEKKHPEAQAVAVIRKSVADMATEDDITGMIIHEAGHVYLGHKVVEGDGEYRNWQVQEKQVADLIGETQVAIDLFAVRYMALRRRQ